MRAPLWSTWMHLYKTVRETKLAASPVARTQICYSPGEETDWHLGAAAPIAGRAALRSLVSSDIQSASVSGDILREIGGAPPDVFCWRSTVRLTDCDALGVRAMPS